MTTRIKITCKIKETIINRQNNKCANSPFNPAINLADYKCPFWICNNGYVDESGFDIDHIEEFSITYNNELNNLQALCKCCHSIKTKKFMKTYKSGLTSYDLYTGMMPMDIDKLIIKKRKKE